MHWLVSVQAAAQTAVEGAKAVAAPAAGDVNEVVPYLTSAALIMFAQRALKNFAWYQAFVRAVPGSDKWAHRIVAASGSLIAALGIHITFTGDILTGGTFQGTYPTIFEMVHGFADWVKVFALQQWAYDSSRRPEEQILHELRAIAIGTYATKQRQWLPPELPPAQKPGGGDA